jgi:hypothetical protein
MELKEFGKYLKYKSFQQVLHKVRQKSYERILASERSVSSAIKRRKPSAKPGARRLYYLDISILLTSHMRLLTLRPSASQAKSLHLY